MVLTNNQALCYDRYMYILTVIPIKKGIGKEYLSYFSAENIPTGTIVSVPLRSRNIDALVIHTEDAIKAKTDLKSAKYQLKKIIGVKGLSPFTREFFTACNKMKDYVVSETGSVIDAMFPSRLLENIKDLKESKRSALALESENVKHEKLIFQAILSDRISFYRTLIREAFAKKESVFICLPTRYDIDEWREAMLKGIEQYVFTFHSDMPKKELINSYNEAITKDHPVLLIGTGMFLSIPRHDIKTIILENESSDSYKHIKSPYIDVRNFVEILASIKNIKLIFGDTLMRPETLERHDKGYLGEIHPPHFRLPKTEDQKIVDMKKEVDGKGMKKFSVISDEVRDMIKNKISNGESVFLYTVRKGLAGNTVCHDCGNSVLCPSCSTPLVLYGAKQRSATKINLGRIFMCNKCGYKESTEIKCSVCSSWNLTPLGIGTDRVYEETKSLFPKAHIVEIDRESTPKDEDARKAIESFYKKDGSILIGTEMVFSYLKNQVDASAIISLDGLLSIPSFNITQKILHILERLSRITKGEIFIQTRLPENQILSHILSGNVLPLYREDLREREMFGYPPFKRLIKITFTGTAPETEKARKYLDHVLKDYDPQIFSAFIGKVKGQYVTNTVIKVNPKDWPLPESGGDLSASTLHQVLSNLPQAFLINVDPEDLL